MEKIHINFSSIPIASNILAQMIRAAYVEAVSESGSEVVASEELSRRIDGVAKWATNADRQKNGLMLHGETPGTGKTTMAVALYRIVADFPARKTALIGQIRAKALRYEEEGHTTQAEKIWAEIEALIALRWDAPPVVFLTAREISSIAENGGRAALLEDEGSPAKIPLLFIDDLGDEPGEVHYYGKSPDGQFYNSKIAPLVEVLLYRYENRLPVIITTNFGTDGIRAKYGPRIEDRLREMCEGGYFSGKSYRK